MQELDIEQQDHEELSVHEVADNSVRTKKIAVVGILAALSAAIAPVASFVPRLNWGIALIDPVSFVWIIAFLIGGPYIGGLTMVVGTLGLGFWDPTFVGPFFKLVATLPMMLVPAIYTTMHKDKEKSKLLSRWRIYFALMVIAFIVRIAIMVPINIVLVPILMGFDDIQFIIDYTILINVVQGFWDALIPYLIVFKTKLYDHFKMW